MYYIAPVPSQFVDHSGVPYAGGSVAVRYTGDTTLTRIYRDAEGASLLQNPCPLDSHGSWVCFVPAGIALDYVVMDKDDHVVFSFDSVVAASGGDGTGVTKNYVDSHDQELRVMIENLGDDVSNKLDKNGDGKDVYVTFEEARERTSLESRDTLSVLMGKIKKWLSSLKALAFKDKADLTSDVSGILPITNGGTGASTAVGARDNLDVYSRDETEALLAGKIVIVTQLPERGESGKIYYLQVEENVYDEYIWGYAPGETEKSWILTDRHEVNFDNYKTKQRSYSKTGSATKTLLSISQNENGEVDAVFGDINLPQQVPHVNIISSGDTISVLSSEDPQTNTKTFDIDVKGSLEYYIGETYTWITLSTDRNIVQDLTRLKGTLNLSAPEVGKYLVCVNLRYKSAGAATNIVGELWVSLGPENTFTQMKKIDYSQNAVEDCMTVVAIKEISFAREPLTISLHLNNAPQAGLDVLVSNVSVYRISSVLGSMTSMESVEHDGTLTGNGTEESPLSIQSALDVSNANTAPEYDPTATYPTVGTLRYHENVLYKSTVAINTAEAWNSAHWTNTSVDEQIGNVEALLAAL